MLYRLLFDSTDGGCPFSDCYGGTLCAQRGVPCAKDERGVPTEWDIDLEAYGKCPACEKVNGLLHE